MIIEMTFCPLCSEGSKIVHRTDAVGRDDLLLHCPKCELVITTQAILDRNKKHGVRNESV